MITSNFQRKHANEAKKMSISAVNTPANQEELFVWLKTCRQMLNLGPEGWTGVEGSAGYPPKITLNKIAEVS